MAEEDARPLGSSRAEGRDEKVHLSLVIPAYNESLRIERTIKKTKSYLETQPFSWELIIVDDGSADDTAQIAERNSANTPGLRVLRVEPNRGKGHALKVGMLAASGRYIGFMDADYKTDIRCTADALAQLEAGWGVVIGSRRLAESHIDNQPKLYRRLGSIFFNKYIHVYLPGLRNFRDTQCGFKFFSRRAAREIFSRQIVERFMFDAEVLHLAQRLGFRVTEIPVIWSSDHDTRTKIVESIVRNTADLLRIRKIHKRVVQLPPHPLENGD